MKKFNLLLLLVICFQSTFAQQLVKGKIRDSQTGNALPGATITIKGSQLSMVTDNEGNFLFRDIPAGNKTLVITYVGYETLEMTVSVAPDKTAIAEATLSLSYQTGDAIVVSASKRPEKITDAPASIQVIGVKELEQFAGSNVGELVAKVQGVEYTRSGVTEITFNARGLHSAFNNKVFQLVDGRNSMSSLSGGLPVMNRGTTMKDDLEKLEIVLGPQSALYGPNAHNVIFNFITKDPRKYPGTTVSISAGSRSQFSARLRQATRINNKWAYKLSGEHAVGKEYNSYDSVYVGNQTGTTPYYGPAVAVPEHNVDFDFRHVRGEGHVYYSITPKADLILSGGASEHSFLQVTTGGRNQMRGITYGFAQARFIHPRFFANIYNTWGSLGTSYAIQSYTRDFWNRTHSSITNPNDPLYKTAGRLPPDSAEMYALRNRFKEESQRLNAELQFNHTLENAGLFLVASLNYQNERPNGYGITLVDDSAKIRVNQYGGALQLEKTLPWRFRLISAMRFDRHDNFGNFFSPKLALVKAIGEGSLRITWGRAYAMPSIQNQYAGIGRTILGNGGTGIYYIPNLANIQDTPSFKTTIPLKPEQVSTWEIGYKGTIAKKLFVDINYYNGISKNFISPTRSVGGRALTVNGRNIAAGNPGRVTNGILSGASFLTFFNYGEVRAYGLDAGLTYSFSKFMILSAKYSWFGSDITEDNLKNDANQDGFVSLEEKSLNAPRNRGMLIMDFQNLCKNRLSLNLSGRFVESYDFYSASQIGTEKGEGGRGIVEREGLPPLLKNFDRGPLGGFVTVDLNAGFKMNELTRINLGITNLLDTKQREFVGSPLIGRLIMFELKVRVPERKETQTTL